MLKKIGFSLLWVWIRQFLESIGEAVWDGTWEIIFEAIAEAEKKWDEGNWAQDKKQFVIEQAISFIENYEGLGWIRKQAVKIFLSTVIDRIISELNDQLGSDWVKQAKKIEDQLDEYFSFID